MIRFGMALVEMIEQLTKGFVKATGRQPDNLEKLKIQQEAVQRFKDMNKVVDMEGNVIDTSKGIMGGRQADKFISKNKTMIDEAIDNASPGFAGDVKYDAQLVADDLAEKRFGKDFYDLDQKQQMDLYDQAYTGLSKQRFKGMKKPKDDPEEKATGGRIGYKIGSIDKARRAFLKAAAGIGGGVAALKTGLLGLSKQPAKQVTEEVVKSAGSGTPPPYFFKLVEKIKKMGDDVTAKNATTERQQIHRYKDYELTEDLTSGEQTIQRIKTDGPEYYDEQLAEEIYMNYKPGAGQSDEAGRVADEYIEDTGYLRTSGPDKGELFDTADGLTDDSLKEIMEEVGEEVVKIKKASGGIARMLGE